MPWPLIILLIFILLSIPSWVVFGYPSLGQTKTFSKILKTSQPGPGAAREKFGELTSPTWTFYVTQGFLSRDLLGFWSLGYPGAWGLGWRGHACVKNLP